MLNAGLESALCGALCDLFQREQPELNFWSNFYDIRDASIDACRKEHKKKIKELNKHVVCSFYYPCGDADMMLPGSPGVMDSIHDTKPFKQQRHPGTRSVPRTSVSRLSQTGLTFQSRQARAHTQTRAQARASERDIIGCCDALAFPRHLQRPPNISGTETQLRGRDFDFLE